MAGARVWSFRVGETLWLLFLIGTVGLVASVAMGVVVALVLTGPSVCGERGEAWVAAGCCGGCGYCLDGLEAGVCPECGGEV